jgi:hypothetical protein
MPASEIVCLFVCFFQEAFFVYSLMLLIVRLMRDIVKELYSNNSILILQFHSIFVLWFAFLAVLICLLASGLLRFFWFQFQCWFWF